MNRNKQYYIKTKCRINDKEEIMKHYPIRKSPVRESGKDVTPEEMAKQNLWLRIRNLRRLLELNFKGGDFHVILTCRPEERPDLEKAMEVIRNFRDKLRDRYKTQGWILKYIITTELGERGAVHWHMIINNMQNEKTSTTKMIHSLWKRGRPYFVPMDDNREYGKLAEYIVKETSKRIADGKTLEKLSYMSSRNLIRPVVREEKVRAAGWREKPSAKKGWEVVEDSVLNGINKFTGLPYQHYTIRKIPWVEDKKKKGRKKVHG